MPLLMDTEVISSFSLLQTMLRQGTLIFLCMFCEVSQEYVTEAKELSCMPVLQRKIYNRIHNIYIL